MTYFTIDELTRSATAKRLGIDNTPTREVKENLTALVEKVLDPLRKKFGRPIVVTSGYRCEKLNKAVGGAKNSQHCFDEKTEILTESGWKTYMDICQDDMVYSYNVNKNQLELTPIDSIIMRNYNGKMMHMNTTCVDVMVTDKHRMLVRYASHKYKKLGTRKISSKGQGYFDSLKTNNDKYHFELAEDVFGKRRIYKCASKFDGQSANDIDLLRFCMAFICDGYWCKKGTSLGIGFRFKKERKVAYLRDLADALGWKYTINFDKNGVYNFYFRTNYARPIFDIVGKQKLLPSYLVSLSIEDKKSLLECYASFDGCYDKRDDGERFSICTTIKHNSDILQAMAITSGIKCAVYSRDVRKYFIKGKSGISKQSYVLLFCLKSEVKVNEEKYKWVDYNGIVWCVNNRNTTLVIRRNGKVSVQGNCKGQAADIRTVSDSREDNLALLRCVLSSGLPFDKLISEFVDVKGRPDWIHISYSPQERGIKMTCKGGLYFSGIKV